MKNGQRSNTTCQIADCEEPATYRVLTLDGWVYKCGPHYEFGRTEDEIVQHLGDRTDHAE